MFKPEWKENQESKVDFIDIDLEVFEEFLNFIYSGKVSTLDQNAMEILVVADKVLLWHDTCSFTSYYTSFFTVPNRFTQGLVRQILGPATGHGIRLRDLVVCRHVPNLVNQRSQGEMHGLY